MSQNEFIHKKHEANIEWFNKLDFYIYEIKLLQDHLETVTEKNKQKDVLMVVEKSRNQLIICRNTIEEIRHKLIMENLPPQEMTRVPATADQQKTEYHQAETHVNQILEKVFTELSEVFNQFTSK